MTTQRKCSLKFICFTFLILSIQVNPSFASLSGEDDLIVKNAKSKNDLLPCHHVPDAPYNLESGHLPEYLEKNMRFNYLQTWSYRYWVATRVFDAGKYIVGVAGLFCLTASKWDFFSEGQKLAFQTASIPLGYTYGVLEGVTTATNSRANTYRNDAIVFVERANHRAGLPVQGQVAEFVVDMEDKL